MNDDPKEIARAVGASLREQDSRFLSLLGIAIDDMQPGAARCSMPVRDDMLNAQAYCQGGFVFALADTAFAYACSSKNRAMLTLSANVVFISAARSGDILSADATLIADGGRTGTCEVEVRNQSGQLVARYQGTCYREGGSIV